MEDSKAIMDFEDVGVVDTGDDESPAAVYEIGYHILPTLSEGEVQQAVSNLMEALKKNGAAFVGDRFPSKIQLAYPIAKRVNGKRTNYDSAYFGWVAFEVAKETVAKIKEMLDGNPAILRYLIVTTSRDAVAAALSGATAATLGTAKVTGNIEKPKRAEEEGGEVSEVALEEALKDIASEDAKAND